MAEPQIRFQDGAGYERMMGVWSRLAGAAFLDWLEPRKSLRWLDVGCGNGAFTELLVSRCAPSSVTGVDPSDAQLEFARARAGTRSVEYLKGDAMALPLADGSADAAVMALVLFFVPQPARGVAEMVRAVAPGGIVSAYAWDILGGGFPLAALQAEMRALDIPVLYPPSVEAAGTDHMTRLWTGAGLHDVQTTRITVERTFDNFADVWETSMLGSSVGATVRAQPAQVQHRLKERLRERLAPVADQPITLSARANAVRGTVPLPR